jgi:hypothetical protein
MFFAVHSDQPTVLIHRGDGGSERYDVFHVAKQM